MHKRLLLTESAWSTNSVFHSSNNFPYGKYRIQLISHVVLFFILSLLGANPGISLRGGPSPLPSISLPSLPPVLFAPLLFLPSPFP